jgi:hypothetical protein
MVRVLHLGLVGNKGQGRLLVHVSIYDQAPIWFSKITKGAWLVLGV